MRANTGKLSACRTKVRKAKRNGREVENIADRAIIPMRAIKCDFLAVLVPCVGKLVFNVLYSLQIFFFWGGGLMGRMGEKWKEV